MVVDVSAMLARPRAIGRAVEGVIPFSLPPQRADDAP